MNSCSFTSQYWNEWNGLLMSLAACRLSRCHIVRARPSIYPIQGSNFRCCAHTHTLHNAHVMWHLSTMSTLQCNACKLMTVIVFRVLLRLDSTLDWSFQTTYYRWIILIFFYDGFLCCCNFWIIRTQIKRHSLDYLCPSNNLFVEISFYTSKSDEVILHTWRKKWLVPIMHSSFFSKSVKINLTNERKIYQCKHCFIWIFIPENHPCFEFQKEQKPLIKLFHSMKCSFDIIQMHWWGHVISLRWSKHHAVIYFFSMWPMCHVA